MIYIKKKMYLNISICKYPGWFYRSENLTKPSCEMLTIMYSVVWTIYEPMNWICQWLGQVWPWHSRGPLIQSVPLHALSRLHAKVLTDSLTMTDWHISTSWVKTQVNVLPSHSLLFPDSSAASQRSGRTYQSRYPNKGGRGEKKRNNRR